MSHAHALVIGKFAPPHNGHLHLIEVAARSAQVVTVLAIASTRETLPLDTRVRALRAELAARGVANVRVVGTLEDLQGDVHDDAAWRAHVLVDQAALRSAEGRRSPRLRPDPFDVAVDAVFSSEAYGEELALRLGAASISVDPSRTQAPGRATDIRSALAAACESPGLPVELARRSAWELLPPATRAGLTRRVCVTGAESTGTTTLAVALATHYDSVTVPEYGRFYSERRAADARARGVAEAGWRDEEFELICRQQHDDEDRVALAAGPVLVCDTDALATTIWQRRYTGHITRRVQAAADSREYTAYLVTSPAGIDWEDDGIRDGEHLRAAMHEEFVAAIAARAAQTGEPFTVLAGSPEQRLRDAVAFLDPLLPLDIRA